MTKRGAVQLLTDPSGNQRKLNCKLSFLAGTLEGWDTLADLDLELADHGSCLRTRNCDTGIKLTEWIQALWKKDCSTKIIFFQNHQYRLICHLVGYHSVRANCNCLEFVFDDGMIMNLESQQSCRQTYQTLSISTVPVDKLNLQIRVDFHNYQQAMPPDSFYPNVEQHSKRKHVINRLKTEIPSSRPPLKPRMKSSLKRFLLKNLLHTIK
ncbi:hypothetical protein J6590_023884 [Homalodisca vitripennis]|nr:hypothetical protein J6590_023884 [Homalodisca vitripennis]